MNANYARYAKEKVSARCQSTAKQSFINMTTQLDKNMNTIAMHSIKWPRFFTLLALDVIMSTYVYVHLIGICNRLAWSSICINKSLLAWRERSRVKNGRGRGSRPKTVFHLRGRQCWPTYRLSFHSRHYGSILEVFHLFTYIPISCLCIVVRLKCAVPTVVVGKFAWHYPGAPVPRK